MAVLAPVGRLWRAATEPHPQVTGDRERARARLLASLLLPLIPLTVLSSVLTPLLRPEPLNPFTLPGSISGLATAAALVVIYALSRSRRVDLASRLVVAVSAASILFAAWVNRAQPDRAVTLYFLGAGILLCSLFLTFRATLLLTAAQMAALPLLRVVAPEFTALDIVSPLLFLALVSALVLVHSWLRERDQLRLDAKERALVESEDRYRTLFSSTVEGIAVHAQGVVIEANAAFEELLGIPRGLARGRPLAMHFVGPTDALEAAGVPPWETRAVRLDGTLVPVELITKRAFYGGHAVFVTAWRDLTERQRAEHERAAAMSRLEEIDRLKAIDRFRTEFINSAAHELATPLTPIRLQLHVLEREAGALPESTRKSLSLLSRNVQRLSTIVTDLLESARVQSNQVVLKAERVDLNALVLEVLETFHTNAQQARVRLVSRLQPGATVVGDAGRLTQVLFNLVSNAMKYTPPEGEITVTTRGEDERVIVEVFDTGAGLSTGQLARLFRPFAKVHEGTTEQRPGTGLGLYISKGIVELHGGKLGARSDGPGRGSTFFLEVPRERAPSPAKPGSGAAKPERVEP